MATTITNFQVGGQNTDIVFSAIIFEELNKISPFIAGTYNSSYERVEAGTTQIYKPTKGAIIDPSATPGEDISTSKQDNPLLTIFHNNVYSKGYKIAEAVNAMVSFDQISTAAKDVGAVIGKSEGTGGLACLTEEGTAVNLGNGVTTKTNVKERILSIRSTATTASAIPTIIMMSVSAYTALLGATSGNEFIQNINESVVRSGRIGTYFGFTVIETNLLGNVEAKYYDSTNTLKTVDTSNVEIIMYDPVGFSIAGHSDKSKISLAPLGFSVYALGEKVDGFSVLDAARIYVGSPDQEVLTFSANTGTGTAMDTLSQVSGTTATLTTNTYTKGGNTFANWNTASAGGGTDYADGATYTFGNEDVTLYAQWTSTG
jgi:hypothetical protein